MTDDSGDLAEHPSGAATLTSAARKRSRSTKRIRQLLLIVGATAALTAWLADRVFSERLADLQSKLSRIDQLGVVATAAMYPQEFALTDEIVQNDFDNLYMLLASMPPVGTCKPDDIATIITSIVLESGYKLSRSAQLNFPLSVGNYMMAVSAIDWKDAEIYSALNALKETHASFSPDKDAYAIASEDPALKAGRIAGAWEIEPICTGSETQSRLAAVKARAAALSKANNDSRPAFDKLLSSYSSLGTEVQKKIPEQRGWYELWISIVRWILFVSTGIAAFCALWKEWADDSAS